MTRHEIARFGSALALAVACGDGAGGFTSSGDVGMSRSAANTSGREAGAGSSDTTSGSTGASGDATSAAAGTATDPSEEATSASTQEQDGTGGTETADTQEPTATTASGETEAAGGTTDETASGEGETPDGTMQAVEEETTDPLPDGEEETTVDDPMDPLPVSWTNDMLPFIASSCGADNTGCHAKEVYAGQIASECRGWLSLADEPLGGTYWGEFRFGESTGCPDLPLYDRLMGETWQCDDVPYVDPGNPENSYLYRKIAGGPYCMNGDVISDPMPQVGQLDPETIDMVRRWIEAGAPFDG